MKSSKTFNFKLLGIALCCVDLHHFAFVMRRSRVRLLFRAIHLNPIRIAPYSVFPYSQVSDFEHSWHTHGTLFHNKPQLITFPTVHSSFNLKISIHTPVSCESLFNCAFNVPRQSIRNSNCIKINDLHFQNFALDMRRCVFSYQSLFFSIF